MARPHKAAPGLTPGAHVYYPAHGVGELISTEESEVAGISLEMHVISFARERMTLRVPTNKVKSTGLVLLDDFAPEATVKKALATMVKDRKVSRAMWSRRAAELEAKIAHGDLIMLAEAIRDLNRAEGDTNDPSYSEGQLLKRAGERFVDILCIVRDMNEFEAQQFLNDHLKKHSKAELRFSFW